MHLELFENVDLSNSLSEFCASTNSKWTVIARGGSRKFRKRGPSLPPSTHSRMKTSLFRTCSNKVTLTFQKDFENTRKKGGPLLGPSPKSAYDCCVFKFLWLSVDRGQKTFVTFSKWNTVFKFLWRNVNGAVFRGTAGAAARSKSFPTFWKFRGARIW